MIDIALLSIIRRWHLREEIPIREIERRTGLSRNTIRKNLRSGAVEPKFKVPDRPSNLDPFADRLEAWLRVEAGKSCKQRRTAQQMHNDLVKLGYPGSTLSANQHYHSQLTLVFRASKAVYFTV